MAKKEEALSISTSASMTRTEMVSEALVHGEGRMQVSDSVVAAPATQLGILDFLFSSVKQWSLLPSHC